MIIHGRTMEVGKDGTTPLGHAEVKVVGIWKNLSTVAKKPPAPPNVVFIHPPLYASRSPETPCVAGDLREAKGADTTLMLPAGEGATKIRLADVRTLRPIDLLRIDVGDPYREEMLSITTLSPSLTADPSAWVTLSRPLMFPHRAGAIVQKLDQTWHDSATALLLEGHRGHSSVFLKDLRGVKTNKYLCIGSPSGRVAEEVHRFQVYETESDDQGFYQLPPLQRVGQVQLQATSAGKRVEVKLQPEFSTARNQVDFVFKKSQTPIKAEENHA